MMGMTLRSSFHAKCKCACQRGRDCTTVLTSVLCSTHSSHLWRFNKHTLQRGSSCTDNYFCRGTHVYMVRLYSYVYLSTQTLYNYICSRLHLPEALIRWFLFSFLLPGKEFFSSFGTASTSPRISCAPFFYVPGSGALCVGNKWKRVRGVVTVSVLNHLCPTLEAHVRVHPCISTPPYFVCLLSSGCFASLHSFSLISHVPYFFFSFFTLFGCLFLFTYKHTTYGTYNRELLLTVNIHVRVVNCYIQISDEIYVRTGWLTPQALIYIRNRYNWSIILSCNWYDKAMNRPIILFHCAPWGVA